MANLERIYTIPLRKEWLKVSRYKRAKKAVKGVLTFLQKHMKSEDVRLGRLLNVELWKHGIRNPPSRVKVTAVKDDKNVVRAELFGAKTDKKETKPVQDKKEQPKPSVAPAAFEQKTTAKKTAPKTA